MMCPPNASLLAQAPMLELLTRIREFCVRVCVCACVSSSRVWLRIATAAQSCLRGLLRVFIVFKIRGFWAIGLIERFYVFVMSLMALCRFRGGGTLVRAEKSHCTMLRLPTS